MTLLRNSNAKEIIALFITKKTSNTEVHAQKSKTRDVYQGETFYSAYTGGIEHLEKFEKKDRVELISDSTMHSAETMTLEGHLKPLQLLICFRYNYNLQTPEFSLSFNAKEWVPNNKENEISGKWVRSCQRTYSMV